MSPAVEERAAALRAAVESGRMAGVEAAVAGLDEPLRKALRQATVAWLRERRDALKEGLRTPTGAEGSADAMRRWADIQRRSAALAPQLEACRLALVALGTQREAEAALFSGFARLWLIPDRERPVDHSLFYRAGLVLRDRGESWCAATILKILDVEGDDRWREQRGSASAALSLSLLREGGLPEAELLPLAAQRAAEWGLWSRDWSDPLDRRLVWTCLETRGATAVASSDYGGQVRSKLVQAVADGLFDRLALLDLALARLVEASRPPEASWWARLIDGLQVTDAEWRERGERALDLAAAGTPAAANLGITITKRLLAAGALTPEAILPLLGPAVGSTSVGVAKAAIALLKQVAKSDPGSRQTALELALGGLAHPKPAVQEVAVAWLERERWWLDHDDLVQYLTALAEAVAPATAVRLRTLLPAAPALVDAAAPAADGLREAVTARLAQETDDAGRTFLTACLDALDGSAPVPEPLGPGDELWRDDPPLELPQTPEETARLFLRRTSAWFAEPDASLFWAASERSRSDAATEPATRPASVWFAEPVASQLLAGLRLPLTEADRPVVQRLLDPVLDDQIVGDLARLWSGATKRQPRRPAAEPSPEEAAATARHAFAAAAEAFARGLHEPPLGTPTHRSGWLDPEVLAARLRSRSDLSAEELYELGTALYRLAPGQACRQRAWERLAPDLGRLGTTASLALTAALDPAATDEAFELLARRLGAQPDLAALRLWCAARWCRRQTVGDQPPAWAAQVLPGHRDEFPTLWSSSLWRLPYYDFELPGLAAFEIRRGTDWYYRNDPDLAVLSGLPPRELLPTMTWLCSARGSSVRAKVGQVLLDWLGHGRLTLADLVSHISRRVTDPRASAVALLGMLAVLSQDSPPYAEAVGLALEQACAHGLGALHGTHRVAILEALLAQRSAAGRGIEDEAARQALLGLAAKGQATRAAALAKQLLDLPPRPAGTPSAREVGAQHDVRQALRLSPAYADLVNEAGET